MEEQPFRLEADPCGERLAHRLLATAAAARPEFCAAVCEAALGHTGVTHPPLYETIAEIRRGAVEESRRGQVRAVVEELDLIAWDLASQIDAMRERHRRDEEAEAAYALAFCKARAAGAVEQALGDPEVAPLEVVYEAHHAGLAFDEIEQILIGLT